MKRTLSLAYLTSAPLTPPDAVTLAAKLGYQHVGLRVLPSAPGGDFAPLIENRLLLAETKARITDTGVSVFDVEIIRLDADFSVARYMPFLDLCGELGARAILTAGDDADSARLTASFAAFCDAAAPYGLTADLEFMPWTAVSDCRAARAIIEGADRPNGRILIDALHVARSTTSLADLQALPPAWLSYAQICDAPAQLPDSVEGLIHTARLERLLPGDGGIALKDMFAVLPADLPISVEIPNETSKAVLGIEEWARQAKVASLGCLS